MPPRFANLRLSLDASTDRAAPAPPGAEFGSLHVTDSPTELSLAAQAAKANNALSSSHRPSVDLNMNASMERSFEVSQNGTFKAGGFELNRQGFKGGHFDGSGGVSDDADALMQQATAMTDPSSKEASQRRRRMRQQKNSVSNDPHHISPEDIVDMDLLGAGVSGFVRKAINHKTMDILAIKNVDIFDKGRRHQMVKELHAFQSASCPYLVRFVGAFFSDGSTKLALEYMNRGSLQQVIDSHGPLDEPCLAQIAKQTVLGLDFLHSSRKVHRDVKPANILCNHDGVVKISDFGILAELGSTAEKCSTFVGTAVYMSPERIKSENYSYPSDIWSLGMSLITMALGRFPFSASEGFFGLVHCIDKEPPPVLDASFSDNIRSFLAATLVKCPEDRWTTQQLLEHPFIRDVDPSKSNEITWPFPSTADARADDDVDFIIDQVLLKHVYPPGGTPYRKSLYEQSRFARLSDQLGMSIEAIQERFEIKLRARDEGGDADDGKSDDI